MNENFEINIDNEKIRVSDEWLTVAEISDRIKRKVEAGDYRVAQLSMALEQLETTLQSIQTLSVKLTPEVKSALDTIAEFEEEPLQVVVRRALVHYVASEDATNRLFKARRAQQEAAG